MSRWLLIWILALALTASGWFGFEHYWRSQGYTPSIMDSLDLWSLHRKRVVLEAPPTRVALLGASRIQYGIAPETFKAEAASLGLNIDPVMLAVSAKYPLAALRDLSEDSKFRGIAIVGIDSRGFNRAWRDMQQQHVDYYRHDFTPAKELHRLLLTQMQKHFIATRPDFAALTLINHGAPWKDYLVFTPDRAGATDYSKSGLAAIRTGRLEGLKRTYSSFTPPTPAEWLAANRDIVGWVEKINSRGGKVVFYREPVSDEHFQMDEERFPRAAMWDELAKIMPATMIDFQDHHELRIDTPDMSHIDMKDIERHSRALVRVLRQRGVW